MYKVAIVDDNALLRENISDRISEHFHLVLDTDNAYELLAYLAIANQADVPDLVLMDIEMDEIDGITATRKLKEKHPEIRVIMLTVFANDDKVWQSILAGADGYILKDESKERLVLHMHDVLQGGSYMSPAIARKALAMMKKGSEIEKHVSTEIALLTKREYEILELIGKGYSHKQMAENLFISPATAKTHINNVYKKLQVNNRIEAVNKLMGVSSNK